MAPLVSAVEVDCPAEEAFAYAVDPSTFHEWQRNVVEGRLDGPPGVGARCHTVRRVGGTSRPVTSEITAYAPPRHWADHGVDGPIRGIVAVDVEPLGDSRCRIRISLDFEGRGIGALLVPLVVRRSARQEMPDNMQALKQRLEARMSARR